MIKLFSLGFLLLTLIPIRAAFDDSTAQSEKSISLKTSPDAKEEHYYRLSIWSNPDKGLQFGPEGSRTGINPETYADFLVTLPLTKGKVHDGKARQEGDMVQKACGLHIRSPEGSSPIVLGEVPLPVKSFTYVTRLNFCKQVLNLDNIFDQLAELPSAQLKELILDEARVMGKKAPRLITETDLGGITILTGLTYLSMKSCNFVTIPDLPPFLIALDLSNNPILRFLPRGSRPLTQDSKTYPTIQALNLSRCESIRGLNDWGQVCDAFPQVEHLSMHESWVNNDSLRKIATQAGPKIKSLDVSISDVDFKEPEIRILFPNLVNLNPPIWLSAYS